MGPGQTSLAWYFHCLGLAVQAGLVVPMQQIRFCDQPQNSLHSYRDWLEYWNFPNSMFDNYTFMRMNDKVFIRLPSSAGWSGCSHATKSGFVIR